MASSSYTSLLTTPLTAASTDPGILKKGTKYEEYETPSGHIYPQIRTFYYQPTHAKKLPENIPLLVFTHGLGGSAAQFAPLLTSLTQIAPCLAIDLPGCGLSDPRPQHLGAYTTTAFAELLFTAIDRYRNKAVNQKVVLIGHSMGCSINALLASSTSALAHLCSDVVMAMVAVCPRSHPLSEEELVQIQRLSYIPPLLLDLFRMVDRRGGVESHSVARVVGKHADLETRKLQLRFNQQSRSSVFRRFLMALRMQEIALAQKGEASLLGPRIWAGVRKPLLLIAAADDKLTPPSEIDQISKCLMQPQARSVVGGEGVNSGRQDSKVGDNLASIQGGPSISSTTVAGDASITLEHISPANTETSETIVEKQNSTRHSFVLKSTVFPAPSSHGLLYAVEDVRVLAGLIENFLAAHVDHRLSPGWQLQHLTTSGKWDVKNLIKWQSIEPCSAPIAGIFRAMKTMRQVDDVHCPTEFVKKYSWKSIPTGVAMVVDISFDTPVYDKNDLEAGDVEYHKFPTVSKLPPSADEVEQFVALVDQLRQSPKIRNVEPGRTPPTIGVHCHYGSVSFFSLTDL
jgi:pimeloyl-ACP methyl ester carboxylesterase